MCNSGATEHRSTAKHWGLTYSRQCASQRESLSSKSRAWRFQIAQTYRLVADGGGGGGGNDGQGKRVLIEELAATFASEMSFLKSF